jgi:glycerate 2-kinase
VRYLIAPDSFKGTLPALDAAGIIASAILRADASAEVDICPLSDGGDGFLDVYRFHAGGTLRYADSVDALGSPIRASWLFLPPDCAIIESATAIGLAMIAGDRRNPRRSSSAGLGLLIRDAMDAGCRTLTIGLGGTATNDCGLGLLRSLGFAIDVGDRTAAADVVSTLKGTVCIRKPESVSIRPTPSVTILADVTNPLLGSTGATATFARQKGAEESELPAFEEAIAHFSAILRRDVRDVDPGRAGMGAAGGLGFALSVLFDSDIRPGIGAMLHLSRFRERCGRADVIVTGEGRIDAQTAQGKVISGVCAEAARAGLPVIAIAGLIDGDPGERAESLGLQRIIRLSAHPGAIPVTSEAAGERLAQAVAEAWKSSKPF